MLLLLMVGCKRKTKSEDVAINENTYNQENNEIENNEKKTNGTTGERDYTDASHVVVTDQGVRSEVDFMGYGLIIGGFPHQFERDDILLAYDLIANSGVYRTNTAMHSVGGRYLISVCVAPEKDESIALDNILDKLKDVYLYDAADHPDRAVGYKNLLPQDIIMETTENVTVAKRDCLRFEGQVITEPNEENYSLQYPSVGYLFVKDGYPIMMMGTILGYDGEGHEDEMKYNLETALKTVRDIQY